MVVLASDTITAPLLPRHIHFHTQRKLSSSSSSSSSSSLSTNRNNIANSWSTKTKIIFAVCVVTAIVLVFALALFLQCRRKRRLARGQHRSSMETIAENQGYGGFKPGIVRQLTDQMDRKDVATDEERFSEQSGPGMYGARPPPPLADDEGRFENVPLEGGAPPRPPTKIYRYGSQQSRFSP